MNKAQGVATSRRPKKTALIVAATSREEIYTIARRQRGGEEVAVTPTLIAVVRQRISAIKAGQLKELQLKLFPDWPDDRRGAPNTVRRSAIFGVVRRGAVSE